MFHREATKQNRPSWCIANASPLKLLKQIADNTDKQGVFLAFRINFLTISLVVKFLKLLCKLAFRVFETQVRWQNSSSSASTADMEHESLKLELYRTNKEEDTKKMTGEWKKKEKDLENGRRRRIWEEEEEEGPGEWQELKQGSEEWQHLQLEYERLKFHHWSRVLEPWNASLLNSFASLTTN